MQTVGSGESHDRTQKKQNTKNKARMRGGGAKVTNNFPAVGFNGFLLHTFGRLLRTVGYRESHDRSRHARQNRRTHVLQVADVVLPALRPRGKSHEGVPLHPPTTDVRRHEVLPGTDVHLPAGAGRKTRRQGKRGERRAWACKASGGNKFLTVGFMTPDKR